MSRYCFLLLLGAAAAPPAGAAPFPITRDGRPAATIVLAKEATRSAEFAAAELQYHVRRMTGASLPIARDGEKVSGPRILVGESAATRKLGIQSKALKAQEYLIRFLPDTLVLMGRDKQEPASSNVRIIGSPQWAAGRLGGGMKFTGADALAVEDCGFSDAAGTMELWAWLPAQPAEGEQTLLRLDGGEPWTYHILRRMGRQVIYVIYDGQGGSSVSSKELPEGWHHIAATHDQAAGKLELFIDGVSQGTAKLTRTLCKGATLQVGGMVPGEPGGKVGNPFTGILDEMRISTAVEAPGDFSKPRAPAAGTTLLLHLDETAGAPRDSSGLLRAVAPPEAYDEQGTCYAVYDFLERFCGVRWYAPGEIGLVCPERKTLAVAGKDVRRAPAFRFRQGTYLPVYGILKELWNNPSAADVRLFARRMRLGGEPYAANHSFYGYYDRFWKEKPDGPGAPEGYHPEWFAKGYAGKPPQMCFTNQGFVNQVIQDARDYFDGKGAKPGAQANGDFFALVPMDNSSWCQCPDCQAQLDPAEKESPQFSNGWASDCIFGFANKVAKEIRRSHPGKYLATLAYSSYAYYPKHTRLESNIAVQLCLHVRNWWAPAMERNDMLFYRSWTTKEKDRPIYLWLYYCFPEEIATNGKWHCFPGFFAHTIDRQFKMFAHDGIRGAFLNNLGDYLDTYVTFRYMDDPTQNVDQVIDEFHRLYYGAAAEPMKKLYLRIEEIYSNPANYPESIRKGNRHEHQTEELAWRYLGTPERMVELGKLMEQAKALARTDIEKQRVALFEHGIWDYMVEGQKAWAAKQAAVPEIERMKAQAPPRAHVPKVAPAGGDPAKVDWDRAVVLAGWRRLQGFPTQRKPAARLAHDGEFLYVQLEEPADAASLVSDDGIWAGDDWELFFAAARAKPYRQVGINPRGRFLDLVNGEGAAMGESGVKVVSDTSAGRWRVRLAFPLAKLLPGGVRPGSRFYANLCRAPADREFLAWSPTFTDRFHEVSRLGEMVLE